MKCNNQECPTDADTRRARAWLIDHPPETDVHALATLIAAVRIEAERGRERATTCGICEGRPAEICRACHVDETYSEGLLRLAVVVRECLAEHDAANALFTGRIREALAALDGVAARSSRKGDGEVKIVTLKIPVIVDATEGRGNEESTHIELSMTMSDNASNADVVQTIARRLDDALKLVDLGDEE